jgi:hypothetical protein
MKTLFTVAMLCAALTAQGDDRRQHEKRENRNYVIRRQQAYQVQGVPTHRLIIGKREIDIYPNGQMFEGDHMIGVTK